MGFLKNIGSLAGQTVGGLIGGSVSVIGDALDSEFIKEVGQGVHSTTVNSAERIGGLADGILTTAHGVITEDQEKINDGSKEVTDVITTTVSGVKKSASHIVCHTSQVVNGVLNDDLESAGKSAKALAKTAAIATLSIGVGDCGLLDDLGEVVESDALVAEGLIESSSTAFETTNELTETAVENIIEDSFNQFEIETEEVDTELVEVVSKNSFEANQIEEIEPETHFVDPHNVNGYERSDGTYVHGYWRDGDGNTSIDLNIKNGGGYWRSNPSA